LRRSYQATIKQIYDGKNATHQHLKEFCGIKMAILLIPHQVTIK